MTPVLQILDSKISAFLISVIFLLTSTSLAAQDKEAKDFQVDSTLYVYYQLCKERVDQPIVLSMADTLYRMAGEKGDLRMQAVALSTSLDYYYFKGIEDSIVAHTNIVKNFALKTDQPKYYYFSWGKRLIQFYVKSGKLTTAFYEAEKMLKNAQNADDKEGLANCYDVLAVIYMVRKMNKQALENLEKEVEIIEAHNLNKYNLTILYTNIARQYLSENNMPKALDAIKKAEAASVTSANEAMSKILYVAYYNKAKQPEKALSYLKEAQELINSDKRLVTMKKSLYEIEADYFEATGEYAKALEALDKTYEEQKKMGEDNINISLLQAKGRIYLLMGEKGKSAETLMQYITAKDSIDAVNEQNSSSEFSTLLGMEKLNADKKELEMQAQKKQLSYTRIIIALLIACMCIGIIFFYREYHLNKALKRSKDELIRKNQKLMESEEQLSIAKEKAETASQMKTVFIRTMTHEIRTPLNSIVGFSQIISNLMEENNEAQEFAEIIEDNSNKLLKLVDDVLDISDLESGEMLKHEEVDINDCCFQSINQVQPYIKKGVKLEFHSAYEGLVARTSSIRVTQILFNLLHNAAKATEQGSIMLNYTVNNDQIIFTVTDTGIGIPEDKQDEVFERFVKLDDFSQGFGLGLSICRMLANMMGGALVLDKQQTVGCKFILSIPYIKG